MALVKCKECGEKISSSAKICPHCGKKRNPMGLGSWIVAIFMSFVIFSYLNSEVDGPVNNQSGDKGSLLWRLEQKIQKPSPSNSKQEASFITSTQLMSNCAIDFDAALKMGDNVNYDLKQNKYMNKIITVKGAVSHIERDSSNNTITYVALKAGFPWAPDGNTVQCYPQESNRASLENIKIGREVIIVGKFYNYGREKRFLDQERAGNSNFKGSGYYAKIKDCKLAN